MEIVCFLLQKVDRFYNGALDMPSGYYSFICRGKWAQNILIIVGLE